MSTEELVVDFYNGVHFLRIVAWWAYAVANHERVAEQLTSFEKAYGQLLELHAQGKLGVGTADFSAENLELLKQIHRLLEPGLNSNETREAARDIHVLAERCLKALTRSDVPVE